MGGLGQLKRYAQNPQTQPMILGAWVSVGVKITWTICWGWSRWFAAFNMFLEGAALFIVCLFTINIYIYITSL